MVEPALRKTLTLRQFGYTAAVINALICSIVAVVIGDPGKNEGPATFTLFLIAVGPSILLSLWLMTLGRKLRGKSVGLRMFVVVGIGLGFAGTITFAMLPLSFLKWLVTPNVIMAFAIELKTRLAPDDPPEHAYLMDPVEPQPELRPRMSPLVVGGLLGIANDIVCAIGIASHGREAFFHSKAELFRTIAFIGFIPALCCGVVLGLVAKATSTMAAPLRWFVLGTPAIGVVATLSSFFGFQQFLWLACIPTIVGVVILERVTRPESFVPAATARA
ncbi:MAG: hypothetical protein QM831_34360 [Kofleriaceae bacterium]